MASTSIFCKELSLTLCHISFETFLLHASAQASQLRIYNFMTEYVAKNSVKSASVDLLASLPSRKRLTALASQKTDEGNVLILSGAADGSLKRLRMSVPRMFGGDPSSIRIAEDDLAYDEVNPCTTTYGVPHHGAITSISIHPGKKSKPRVNLSITGINFSLSNFCIIIL
jgi:hypothetical protein